MNEITRIHLAATPFNIEIAAKKELAAYLDAVEVALQADADALREIEARMIELLHERGVAGEKVITVADIDEIQQRLGAPSDFSGSDVDESVDQDQGEKRLMRDEERGMLGGVLAGIGAYTGIHPNWVRLVAIILAFASFGAIVLIYVVLWLALPPARTAAEKLQMAGKPVTLASLKQGADSSPYVSHVKPLAVVLRALLGIGFVGAAILAAGVTITSVVFGMQAFMATTNVVNGWLVGAFILLAVSGVLLTLLMVLAAYVSFAWRFTKAIAYGGLAVIIAGMVLFGAGLGGAFYGANVANNQLDALKMTKKHELGQLNETDKVIVAASGLPVEYRHAEGALRAEVTTVGQKYDPIIKASRDGDIVRITITDDRSGTSCFIFGSCSMGVERIVIYGPALKNLELAAGTLTYEGGSQPEMTAQVGGDASLTIQDSSIESLTVATKKRSAFAADNASVTRASIAVQEDSLVRMGIVSQLIVQTPTACPADSAAEVTVERAGVLMHNGADITNSPSVENGCAQITISALQEIDDSAV